MSKSQKPAQGAGAETAKSVCLAEGCKQKPTQAEFCGEHFIWFKEGLVTKAGERPKDFDKKFIAYSYRKKQAA